MHTSAREKDKAGAVIEALVLKNCCDSVDRKYLMDELLKVAQVSQTGTGKSIRLVLFHIHYNELMVPFILFSSVSHIRINRLFGEGLSGLH